MASKKTEKKVLNYRVFIEKETYDDGTPVFVSFVPALGISDYGPTLEDSLKSTEKMIRFHLECLVEESGAIPAPDESTGCFVTTSRVEILPKKSFVFV